MPRHPLSLPALAVCAMLIASCASSPPDPVQPPRLTLPESARKPCVLTVLPYQPTAGDLDAAYLKRGAQIVTCDTARQLAVDTLDAEHRAIDAWLKSLRRCRWFC